MERRRTRKELAKFIFKRGFWPIFWEIVLISTTLSFRPFGDEITGGGIFAFFQMLFVLGVSMIALSGLLFLGARKCLIIGLIIIVDHNAVSGIWPEAQPFSQLDDPIWMTLMTPGTFLVIPFYTVVMHPPIPWIGVILLGYGSSYIFLKEPLERDAYLRKVGIFLFQRLSFYVPLGFIVIQTRGSFWN